MKLLYMSDTHLRTTRPVSRIDKDFYPLQFEKLREVLRMVKELGVSTILHGGDFTHSNDPALSLIYDIGNTLKQVKQPKDFKFFLSPGNHDFSGSNIETIRRSGIGVLSQGGAFDLLDAGVHLLGENVVLRSAPYMIQYPEDFYWFELKEPGKIYAVLAHDMLTTHWVPYPHRDIHALKTNADIVLCSHWHSQFIETVGSTLFVNSGPLDVQTVTEKKTKPAVIILDIEGTKIQPKLEFLKTTGYEEIEIRDEEHQDFGLADDFIKEIQESKIFDNLTIDQAVQMVAKESNTDLLVVERALKRLKEAEACLV